MITSTEDQSIDVDYDIFSLAGRAALIGGGIYALNKSNEEGLFKRKFGGDILNPRKNQHIQKLKEVARYEKSMIEATELPALKLVKSPFNNLKINNLKKAEENFEYINKFADLDSNLFSGGFNGYSKDLQKQLDVLRSKVKGIEGTNPTIGVRYRDVGGQKTIDYISMKTGVGNIRIHAIDKEGFATIGTNAQNRYVARQFYEIGKDGDPLVYGSDVGKVNYLIENYERLNDGELTLKEINDTHLKSLQYDDKNFNKKLGPKSNPELVTLTAGSAMPDPLIQELNDPKRFPDKINPKYKFRKPVAREQQIKFNEKQAVAGRMIGSATDISKGILNLEESDSIYYSSPFRDLSTNPKQLTKDVKYKDLTGKEAYSVDKNVFFISEEGEKVFREVLKEEGIHLGEWGAEQGLLNKTNAGKMVTSKRTLSFHGEQLTSSSNYLIQHMSNIAGMSPEDFALKISNEGGFNAFDKSIQDQLRNIHIDEYQRYLQKELQESNKRKNVLLEVNKGGTSNRYKNDPAAQMARIEAYGLKEKGTLEEVLAKEEAKIEGIRSELKNSSFLGKTLDEHGYEKIGREHKGLLIENIHYDTQSKKVTVQLKNEKRLGVGDKFFDLGGEAKVTVKASIPDMDKKILKTYERMGISLSPDEVQRIKNTELFLPSSAMRTKVTARNAHGVFHGIEHEARLSGNKPVLDIIDNFYKKLPTMAHNQRLQVFHDLDKVAREQGTTLYGLSGKKNAAGFMTSKMLSLGDPAIDMGAGGLGFFTERHLSMFTMHGLDNFSKEVMSRRMNPGALANERNFNEALKYLGDKAADKVIDVSSKDFSIRRFMENVYPDLKEEGLNLASKRKEFFKNKLHTNGVAYVSLGEEVEGINKVAIFDPEQFVGYIGEKIGSHGEYKRYSDLDRLTKQIINEVYRGKKDPEKLKTLVQNYNTAMAQMDSALKKNALGGKVEKSLYGQITTNRAGMQEYSERIAKHFGTESHLGNVVAISDKQFIKFYGEDEYKRIISEQKYLQKYGEEGLKKANKTGISNAWGMLTKEPAEGISNIPVNVVPSSAFADAESLQDFQIAVGANAENSIMKMTYMDTDGDTASLIPALTKQSAEEIQELGYGNNQYSKIFRETRLDRAKYNTKGRSQPTILEAAHDDLRRATFHAKQSEKGLIGVTSNSFAPIREGAILRLAGSKQRDAETIRRAFRTIDSSWTLVENGLKGKYRSFEELQKGETDKVLKIINGRDEFENVELAKRKSALTEVMDEIFLGDNKHLGDRIRAGERSAEMIEALKDNMTVLDDKWFKEATSKEAIDDIFDALDVGKKTGEISENVLKHEEAVASAGTKVKNLLQDFEGAKEDIKQISSGVGKNLFKYALLPAAAFGLAGTILHSKSKITAEGETSDNSYKKSESPNMTNPKYMKPEVKGKARGKESIHAYGQQNSGGSMRVVDDTRTFDHQDLRDMMARGY